jgi:hypothetical protein
MQFDHIGTDKHSNINKMMWRASLAKVIEEIQKCELVCANHHAERTYRRQRSEQ